MQKNTLRAGGMNSSNLRNCLLLYDHSQISCDCISSIWTTPVRDMLISAPRPAGTRTLKTRDSSLSYSWYFLFCKWRWRLPFRVYGVITQRCWDFYHEDRSCPLLYEFLSPIHWDSAPTALFIFTNISFSSLSVRCLYFTVQNHL